MSYIHDYVRWRGCIGMTRAPFAPPDAMALCLVAAAVAEQPLAMGETAALGALCTAALQKNNAEELQALLSLMASAVRFSTLRVLGTAPIHKGVGALTVLLPKEHLFVAFFVERETHAPLPPSVREGGRAWLTSLAAAYPRHRLLLGGIDLAAEVALGGAADMGACLPRVKQVFDFDAFGMHTSLPTALKGRVRRYSPLAMAGALPVAVGEGSPAWNPFAWEIGVRDLAPTRFSYEPNGAGYLTWFGDLSFGNLAVNAIDALLLCKLGYSHFGTVSPDPRHPPRRLREIAMDEHMSGFAADMAATARFGALRVIASSSVYDSARAVQFAALTVMLPQNELLVVFRGTDGTLAGWHEDFRMSYDYPVPAQQYAVQYLKAISSAFPMRRVRVAGHSKGGNLAMFAAVHCGAAFRERIKAVYNFDGPGFADTTLFSHRYRDIRDRIQIYVPQHSVIGMLLDHDNSYRTVRSDAAGIWQQHDIMTWKVEGLDFVDSLQSERARKLNAYFDFVLDNVSPSLKRQFIETVFSLLAEKGMRSVGDVKGTKKDMLRLYNEFKRKNPILFEKIFDVLLRGLDEIDE